MKEPMKKRVLVLVLIPAGISVVLFLCCVLFLRSAFFLWPLTLLPLLFCFAPLHDLIRGPEAVEGRVLIDQRFFLRKGLFPPLNGAVAAFLVGFAVWLASFLGIRSVDDPDLWGPLLIFFISPWIVSVIFLIKAVNDTRSRRQMLKERKLIIAPLPLLEKEESEYQDTDGDKHTALYFFFPDISRNLAGRGGAASSPRSDRFRFSVDSSQYAEGRVGEEYYVLLDARTSRRNVLCCYRKNAVELGRDMGIFVRQLDEMQADYEAQAERVAREEAWQEEQQRRELQRRTAALRMGGEAAEQVRAEMRAEARVKRRNRLLFVLAALGCGVCCMASIPLSVQFFHQFSDRLAPLSAFPPLLVIFGQFLLLLFLAGRLREGKMAPAIIWGLLNVLLAFLGVGFYAVLF